MRKIFQKWLFLVVLAAFAALFGVSFLLQTRAAYDYADDLIQLRLDDVKKQVTITVTNQVLIRKLSDEALGDKVRALAYFFSLAPELAKDNAVLHRIRKYIGSDELHLADRHGIITLSSRDPMLGDIEAIKGYNLALHAQSEPFMEGIGRTDFLLVQRPLLRGFDHKLFQYAGASRLDEPGIVQVGEKATRLQNAMEAGGSIQKLSPSLRIGISGQILICDNEKIVGAARADYEGRTLSSLGLRSEVLSAIDYNADGSFDDEIDGTKVRGFHARSGQYTLVGLLPYDEVIVDRNDMMLMLLVAGLVTLLVVFASVSKLVQKVVIDGIDRINASLASITAGHLEVQVNEIGNQEFRELSAGINSMVEALKAAIAAEKSRLASDLEFARTIQAAALPQIRKFSHVDLFASMETAKEVGGDFYDFFSIDDNRLAFLIADVSGKGIPAAMFMMTAKSQLKSGILNAPDRPLNETVAAVNDSVCENNDACMFVTVFVAVLDLRTGKMEYVNAGHNAPVLRRADGSADWLPVESGFVIGGMDQVPFDLQSIVLQPGDSVLLYTDGVTEAMNPANQLFGDDRLINLMNGPIMQAAPVECVLDEVKAEVAEYVSGAPQSDDITMVYLRYNG